MKISTGTAVLATLLVQPACAEPSPLDDYPSALVHSEKQGGHRDPTIVAIEEGLRDFSSRNDDDARSWTLAERMAANNVPGMAVLIVDDGEVLLSQGYGRLSATATASVDEDTVFSVGSVSKLVNAVLILRLVDEGKLDLDTDVNDYLTRWKIPESQFTKDEKVTLRRLLSHTSGLSQHGFPDFQPGEKLPSIEESLNGEGHAKHEAVRPLFEPGSDMKYSGGGIMVSQLIVEEVTGLDYTEAAKKYVFEPLGMSRSTFENPLPSAHGNIAKAHDREARPQALPRGYESMPEMAASGLWTSADDMGKFLQVILSKSNFLSDEMWEEMLTRQPPSWHGLGPRLNGVGEKAVFHHGGSNDSYQAWFEGHPSSRRGLVVLTNSSGGRMLAYEMRNAVERALSWNINFPDDYDEPE